MRISHKNKFIFFSNPKTGSESLREMLTPFSEILDVSYKDRAPDHPYYSHISPQEVKTLFAEQGYDYDDYYKIVCIRNPFNRLVSLYEMIFRRWPIKPPFYVWLKSTQTSGTGGGGEDHERWRRYGAYSLKNYISDNEGEIIVDKVICLENFDEEIPQLFQDLNITLDTDFKIIKKNVSARKKKVADYYNEKSKQLVFDRYAWEIEKYDYTFPS